MPALTLKLKGGARIWCDHQAIPELPQSALWKSICLDRASGRIPQLPLAHLSSPGGGHVVGPGRQRFQTAGFQLRRAPPLHPRRGRAAGPPADAPGPRDRKSVVWGKSVSVSVDLGGRPTIKKKKQKKQK